ncbi:NADPH:quinone oxidoreductase-like isoform X2 [Macadamia integrifolia]|uniref:NADPH:quinone oxidoreductase-like isoform X2 n=1 Tax=Macadamia integrifolia TaxID=60698 RepID=UPI001C527978|nr:NADPH:quinone oxidoreductase-like isoform X2 [Macadamia integrifolia]
MATSGVPDINVVALCGSLRKASYHRGLIRSAIQISQESVKGMKIEYVDITPLPFINTDLEVNAPLKNAIDWASRPPNVWAGKRAAIVSTGGNFGGGRGQYHLRQIGVYLDMHFINKPEFFAYAFQPPQKFDGEGNLLDADTKQRLKEVLLSLQAFTLESKSK